MEEIEVGEYARTNKGKIFIFAWLTNGDGEKYRSKVLLGNGKIFENKFYYFDDGEEIVKHSKIISEIVEVGDYVNGKLIHKIDKGPNYCYLYYGNCKTLVDYQIKSIVTKEQFKSVEYEVN